MEWSGGDGSGVEGREGEGRAGQGARLLRWTFTGRDFIPLNTPVERAATQLYNTPERWDEACNSILHCAHINGHVLMCRSGSSNYTLIEFG